VGALRPLDDLIRGEALEQMDEQLQALGGVG
jgi:hypothetical protein